MTEKITMNNILYSISKDDIQQEALVTLGRPLTEEEMDKTSKLLQFGLGENLIGIYKIIFNEIAKTQLC